MPSASANITQAEACRCATTTPRRIRPMSRSGTYADVTLTPFSGAWAQRRRACPPSTVAPCRVRRRMIARGLAGRVQIAACSRRHHRHSPDDCSFPAACDRCAGRSIARLRRPSDGPTQRRPPAFSAFQARCGHDIGDTNYGIVGFADAGYVSEGAFGEGDADWHAGAGVGVRYTTPSGPSASIWPHRVQGRRRGRGGLSLHRYRAGLLMRGAHAPSCPSRNRPARPRPGAGGG